MPRENGRGTHGRRRAVTILVAASAVFGAASLGAQSAPDLVREEATYAATITRVADSAIHWLDFFPVRSQVRVQMLFSAAPDSTSALFDALSRRSAAAATLIDDMMRQFGGVATPSDLRELHADLMLALRDARAALDRLSSSAGACRLDARSVSRCQSPFASASSAVDRAYARYLATRVKIRDQVRDTETVLPDFRRRGG
jgi:hypothetical protein